MILRIYRGRVASVIGILSCFALSTTALAQSSAPRAAPPLTAPGGFFIYPKNGQNEAQQSADRYECHTWAQAQTGFDPTAMGGGVAPGERSSRLGLYQRAMMACLDAKGYSVTLATPPAPPPAPTVAPPPVTAPPPARVAPPVAMRSLGPELKYHPFHLQIEGGYSATAGQANQYLDNGGIGGLGLAWFPAAALPIGLRVDGSYNWFRAKDALLNQTGGNFSYGHEAIYGGDVDLQFDLAHRSSRAKLYLLGGVGWYREHTDFQQVSLQEGWVCFWYDCGPGVFPVETASQSMTSKWHRSWNAGLGWEIAVADGMSFFVEARYERILPYDRHMAFVPVTLGLRF